MLLEKVFLFLLDKQQDIFIGNMSIIGPRPALWNQDLLTAERDKYGANDIKPGLTGLAQIKGRDELEIPEKAKLDGEYVKRESECNVDIEAYHKHKWLKPFCWIYQIGRYTRQGVMTKRDSRQVLNDFERGNQRAELLNKLGLKRE